MLGEGSLHDTISTQATEYHMLENETLKPMAYNGVRFPGFSLWRGADAALNLKVFSGFLPTFVEMISKAPYP